MQNVVIRFLIIVLLGAFVFDTNVFAQNNEGGGIGGNYVCNNGCNPTNPIDGLTREFIRSVVNQDVGVWRVGDTVNIYSPDGRGGEWGRTNALSGDHNLVAIISGDGNAGAGGSGNGSGGGGSGGGNGGGGAPWGGPWGPGGGGSSGGGGGSCNGTWVNNCEGQSCTATCVTV